MFSHRLIWDRPENALAALERATRAGGGGFADLTVSNPTQVGLAYPTDALRDALAPPSLIQYEPAPRGLPQARAAVAASLSVAGQPPVDPDHLILTASSSESYALLFKLLCDPGDSVLVPEPSYPLFDYLARLEGVRPVGYPLGYDGSWHIDLAGVEAAIARAVQVGGGRPRALVVVNPNNPTGSFVKRGEQRRLSTLCAGAGLGVISDEVFADYRFPDAAAARPNGGVDDAQPVPSLAGVADAAALTFGLGGLSKSCGLPQVKLGWIRVGGPPSLAAAALEKLELVADTYLSVATPVQLAAGKLLALGQTIRAQLQSRVTENRAALRAVLPPDSPCSLLAAEGGWSAILRVPAVQSDAAWAATLLQQDGILVHPGYFFDMPPGGTYLVVSLLPPPAVFADAVARLHRRCVQAGG